MRDSTTVDRAVRVRRRMSKLEDFPVKERAAIKKTAETLTDAQLSILARKEETPRSHAARAVPIRSALS